MLQIGLNPYGLTYVLGLQGRARRAPIRTDAGLKGFIEIAQELGAQNAGDLRAVARADWTTASSRHCAGASPSSA